MDANTHNLCDSLALETIPSDGVGRRQCQAVLARLRCQRVAPVHVPADLRLSAIALDLIGAEPGAGNHGLLREYGASVPLHQSWLPALLEFAAAPARAHH